MSTLLSTVTSCQHYCQQSHHVNTTVKVKDEINIAIALSVFRDKLLSTVTSCQYYCEQYVRKIEITKTGWSSHINVFVKCPTIVAGLMLTCLIVEIIQRWIFGSLSLGKANFHRNMLPSRIIISKIYSVLTGEHFSGPWNLLHTPDREPHSQRQRRQAECQNQDWNGNLSIPASVHEPLGHTTTIHHARQAGRQSHKTLSVNHTRPEVPIDPGLWESLGPPSNNFWGSLANFVHPLILKKINQKL